MFNPGLSTSRLSGNFQLPLSHLMSLAMEPGLPSPTHPADCDTVQDKIHSCLTQTHPHPERS